MYLRYLFLTSMTLVIAGCSNTTPELSDKVQPEAVIEAVIPAPLVVKPKASPKPVMRPLAKPAMKRVASTSADISTSVDGSKASIKELQPIQSGLLTAGEIDDNQNITAFSRYLKMMRSQLSQYPLVTNQQRIHLKVVDTSGRGVSNAKIKIGSQTYYTRTDGNFYFYPKLEDPQLNTSQVTVSLLSSDTNNKTIKQSVIDTSKKGVHKIVRSGQQNTLPKALDLMFVIDTTGSMSDELRYIKTELNSIISRVKRLHPETTIRYGLVVYRDKGDQYVVRDYKFQRSLATMGELLNKQKADGGGDYPEALDAALEKAVSANWSTGNTARVMFLIADAPPHSNGFGKSLQAAKIAHHKGIRIYPLGASGVKDKAEYVMRHVALVSNGRYQFLTDDSGVGNSHQEPHVSCYVVTRLDQLITRTISSELSGRRVEPSKAEMIRQVGKYDNGVCQ
jgi:hypothetical protein